MGSEEVLCEAGSESTPTLTTAEGSMLEAGVVLHCAMSAGSR